MKTALALHLQKLGFVTLLTCFHAMADPTPPMFLGLGDLPGGAFLSGVSAISADGSTVVGSGTTEEGEEAYRWRDGVMTSLGVLPGGAHRSVARAVNGDGSKVVGWSRSSLTAEPFLWSDGVMTGLGTPPGYTSAQATGISRDGRVIAGHSFRDLAAEFNSYSAVEAFKLEDDFFTLLGDLPGGKLDSGEGGISADGSIITGRGVTDISDFYEAYYWENGTVHGLGYFPGNGRKFSHAFRVSGDGKTIIGVAASERSVQATDQGEACRWVNREIQALGDLPGGLFRSFAAGVSDDGSVIVGQGTTDVGGEAFIWDSKNGMRNLREVLSSVFHLDLTGWQLTYANGISADGTVIAGGGAHDGISEAWLARIDRDTLFEGEAPELTIEQSVTLSWPSSFVGYQLQSSPSLSAPDWQAVVAFTRESDTKYIVTLPAGADARYFRLMRSP